jgi:hypothetical protein
MQHSGADVAKLAEVKTIYSTNARQIPEMLTKLGAEISSGQISAKIDQCVCLARDSSTGKFKVYAWGDIGIDQSISLLAQGHRRLSSIADNGDAWVSPEVPASRP